jgi:hypothetical protein
MDEPLPPSQSVAFIARLGAWLQFAPLIGIVAAIFGVIEAFDILKARGAGDPVSLNAAMDHVITCISIAFWLALTGLVLVTIAITVCGYRSKWMFKFLRSFGLFAIVLGLVLLAFGQFRLGFYLPFGLFFVIFAQSKKQECLLALPPKHKLPDCYKLDP